MLSNCFSSNQCTDWLNQLLYLFIWWTDVYEYKLLILTKRGELAFLVPLAAHFPLPKNTSSQLRSLFVDDHFYFILFTNAKPKVNHLYSCWGELLQTAQNLSESKHTSQPLNPVPMDPRTHHSGIESLDLYPNFKLKQKNIVKLTNWELRITTLH